MDKRIFMKLPLTPGIFEAMWNEKKKSITPVLSCYGVDEETLKETLWEEFNIPGMEVRIANTAMNFIIDGCEKHHDPAPTLVQEIKNDILASGIYYTNIAPNAIL